jgi:hypothetical protein
MSTNRAEQKRGVNGLKRSGLDLDRKYWVAMALYVILAALSWFTLGKGKVFVGSSPVEVRWIPLVVLGGMALKTALARQADRIRRGEAGKAGLVPREFQKKG